MVRFPFSLEPISKMRLEPHAGVAGRLKMLTYWPRCMLRFFAALCLALDPDSHFCDGF
jgi:hypothetical protein